ncbi:MAG: hypothetical protein KAY32_08075, partial [Candidatus Eisenbacteria sp.]|nr:hypothetical protein [Candidatus Eisenbacteria bacterium]
FDFESGDQGWVFERCPGIGAFMDIYTEAEWFPLVYEPPGAVECPCGLSGNALHCATEIVNNPRPGHPRGQHELMISPVVDRGRFAGDLGWNTVLSRFDDYEWLRIASRTFYRLGFFYYPFSTPAFPQQRWSQRQGQELWYYRAEHASCIHNRIDRLTAPIDGVPLPPYWEQMRFCVEVCTGCDPPWPFETPKEGITKGSPIIDNVRIGLTSGVDAPGIALERAHLFHDGFGQNSPDFLDPGDVCNVNIVDNLRDWHWEQNDWHGDTAVVLGPPAMFPEHTYRVELCFKVAKRGPRQEMIPGYSAWKNRLPGDPEADFVCAMMDTAMVEVEGALAPAKSGRARVTYFHEDDSGFAPAFGDRTPEQEILPDLVFTPGTRIEYYYRSRWEQGGSEYYRLPEQGVFEIEFLPMMTTEVCGCDEYEVIWPSVLYIDAFNAGAEAIIVAALEEAGVTFDKFDHLGFTSTSSPRTSMQRSYGGTTYNPGGYGNNGCTLAQLLGYRLILFNSGSYAMNVGRREDFELLESWLTATDCGLGGIRRGLILNGGGIATLMSDEGDDWLAVHFSREILGVTVVDPAYRDYNNDDYNCVWLTPAAGAGFAPAVQTAVFDNGCPEINEYDVLAPTLGTGAIGNLMYEPGSGATDPIFPEVGFAQVVKESLSGAGDVGGWKSIVDGFSYHHLSKVGHGGAECSAESTAVVAGIADLLAAELVWLTDQGAAPFDAWSYTCADSTVDPGDDPGPCGPVDVLCRVRPNPAHAEVNVRFIASGNHPVRISIYDVSGRLVRTLHDGRAERGEIPLTWDGRNDAGRRLHNGVFWVQMSAGDYRSSKELILLK